MMKDFLNRIFQKENGSKEEAKARLAEEERIRKAAEAEAERRRIETEAIQAKAMETTKTFLGMLMRKNFHKAYLSWRDVVRIHNHQYEVMMRAAMHIHMLEVVRLYVRWIEYKDWANDEDEYEVVARLSGTVGDPQWQLHSNLGPQIAKAMNGSMARGYQKKKKELVARLNIETDLALAKVAVLLREQEQKVLDLVNEKSRDVFRLQERVGSLLPAGLRIR